MRRVLLMLLALLFGALTAWQWRDWPREPAPAALAEAPQAGVTGESAAEILDELPLPDGQEHYAGIIERPLFRPDRRPEPPAENAETSAGEEQSDLEHLDLTAVLITPDSASAWVREDSSPQARRLRIGDDIGGWSLLEILPDRIRLERQGEEDALLLRDYSATAPMAAPNAPPGPSPRRPPQMPTRVDPADR